MQCWNAEMEVPYLVPGDSLTNAPQGPFPQKYQATGDPSRSLSYIRNGMDGFLGPSDPAQSNLIQLAPGETVLVPGPLGLYIGDLDPKSFPRQETLVARKNW